MQRKNEKPAPAESKPKPKTDHELSDTDLDKVSGGKHDTVKNSISNVR